MDGKRILQNFPSGVVVMFLLLRLPSVFHTTRTRSGRDYRRVYSPISAWLAGLPSGRKTTPFTPRWA